MRLKSYDIVSYMMHKYIDKNEYNHVFRTNKISQRIFGDSFHSFTVLFSQK